MHCYSGTDHTASFECDTPVNCVMERATGSLVTNLWNFVAALCGTMFWAPRSNFWGRLERSMRPFGQPGEDVLRQGITSPISTLG